MQKVVSLLFLIIFGLFCRNIVAQDELARGKCRTIHGMDVDEGTSFNNSGCLLNCVLHGRNFSHTVNDGFQCPLFSFGTCHDGKCIVNETHQNPPSVRNSSLGYLSIEIFSAKLVAGLNDYANSFVTVSVQNTTFANQSKTIPFENKEFCHRCDTNIVAQTAHPVYNTDCQTFHNRDLVFLNESRLTFEVYDEKNTMTRYFINGVTTTVSQILMDGNINKTITLPMIHGGSLDVRVNWTLPFVWF